jgi:hypothetical protein
MAEDTSLEDKKPNVVTNRRGFNVTVTSVPFTGDEEESRIRESNFHITMNTNVRLDVDDSEMTPFVSGLQEAANELLGDPDNLEMIVSFPYGGEFNPETILNIDVTTRVEIGKDDAHGKRLHLHAILKIRHNSKIRLDFARVKSRMNEILEDKNYPYPVHYVHVEVYNDRGQRVVRYLKKT